MKACDAIENFARANDEMHRLTIEKERIADDMIPVEIKSALRDLDDEYDGMLCGLEEAVEALRDEAKEAVAGEKETVRAGGWIFKYVKGRSGGWDAEKLEALASAMRLAGQDRVADAILACRKPDGKPYVVVEKEK